MQDREQAEKKLVQDFSGDEKKLASLIAVLSEGSRRERQQAARFIAAIAKSAPDVLVSHIAELVDALSNPEAQTRWELFDALTGARRRRFSCVRESSRGRGDRAVRRGQRHAPFGGDALRLQNRRNHRDAIREDPGR